MKPGRGACGLMTALLLGCGSSSDPSSGQAASQRTSAATSNTSAPASATAIASGASIAADAASTADEPIPVVANGVLSDEDAEKILTLAAVRISLLDRGSEPRSPLRYELERPAKQRVRASVNLQQGEVEMPQISLLLELSKTTPRKNAMGVLGKIATATVTAPKDKDSPASVEDVAAYIAPLNGAQLEVYLDPNGRFQWFGSGGPFHVPDNAPAMTKQVFAGAYMWLTPMITELPDGPVGVGARWRVVRRPESRATDGLPHMTIQFDTYTLRSRNGSVVTIDSEMVGFGSDGLPAKTSPLREFRQSGQSTATLDLAAIAPRSSNRHWVHRVVQASQGREEVQQNAVTLRFESD